MSRALQDQFIDDDEDETCPLCVEEFDLTDKGFRPCPCGYQICQFCYHNVKNNMNGLCPACRRTYSDKNIEYKVITPEETAAHRARQAQKQKKSQAALQKERQKAEADHLSRKHLAGLRVVQKNLVYVTGLNPTLQEDQLLATLRGDQYFGQYGKILKIVVSKAKDPSHPHSVGVYVTYERREDAANCIAAVNGSKNGERTLRAQFGTTKYCSAYLRGEQCSNRNCMFLHEPGEANESYSRADLSALNAGSSQHGDRAAPPPQSQQPVASAAPPMTRQSSSDQPHSPASDSRPALPSTASWASRPPQLVPSRAESRSTSGNLDSPAITLATPAPPQPEPADLQPEHTHRAAQAAPPADVPTPSLPKQPPPRKSGPASPLLDLLRNFTIDDFKLVFSIATLPPGEMEMVKSYPPLFDQNGGAKRRLRRQREEERRKMDEEARAFQQPSSVDPDDNLEMSGSLQLGGEPEERQGLGQAASAIQPPGPAGGLDRRFQFGGSVPSPGLSDRAVAPHTQPFLIQQAMKPQLDQGSNLSDLSQPSAFQQPGNNAPPGHQRNVSRFSFANETASASAAVKPVANPKLMNQQSSMMPPNGGAPGFGNQGNPFYTSNVQGPPPGLKATGTPPVSGGMTFGQGHGFATGGLQYGANAAGRNANEEMLRNLLRGRDAPGGDAAAAAAAAAAAKRDADFPPLGRPSIQQTISLDVSRISTPPVPPGIEAQHGGVNESGRSTPTVPPGLSKPTALPGLEGGPSSRPSSRASNLRRQTGHILPALPLTPGTPSRQEAKDVGKIERSVEETPTRAPKKTAAPLDGLGAQVNVGESPADEVDKQEAWPVPGYLTADPEAASTEPEQQVEPGRQQSSKSLKKDENKAPHAVLPRKTSAPLAMQPASKGEATVAASDARAAPVSPSKSEPVKEEGQKRKHPGKLDITAAVSRRDQSASSTLTPMETSTPSKGQRPASQTPSSVFKPDSPTGSVPSPAVKSAPRTLRLTQTPKSETPPPQPFPTPGLPTASGVTAAKLPSRQPSVASINRPGTPSSEQISISDNLSVTSTSVSRASSPPPAGSSKAGTAPVRVKNKNQLRQERQERAKVIEEEKAKAEERAKLVPDEPAQEAIVSRKKKTKREREPKAKAKVATTATTETTPTASRPPSPGQKAAPEDDKTPERAPTARSDGESGTPTRVTPAPAPPPPPTVPSPHEPSPPPTPTMTAQALLAELKATAPELQKCVDSLFRTPTSNQFKPNQPISPKDLQNPASWKTDFKINLTKEDVDALLKIKVPAIKYGGEHGRMWDRGMVTAAGAHLRALTEELEMRFLELEKALREMPQQLRFRPSKPQNEIKFPHADLEALKRQFENMGQRGVSVMEQMVQDGSTMKKGAFLVDEASKYINEFVMPPATPPPPPPSASGASSLKGQATAASAQSLTPEQLALPSLEIAERSLNEARRIAEEKEAQLKKMIKKNKRLLGLG